MSIIKEALEKLGKYEAVNWNGDKEVYNKEAAEKLFKMVNAEAPIEEFEECVGEGKFVYPNKAIYIGQYRQLKTGQKIK